MAQQPFWRLLLLGLLAIATPAPADTLIGRVVGVSDGDTITVLDATKAQHKVRLAGIDAPEKGQPFGSRSKENLSRLVYGKDARVEWQKKDRYGRIVGTVWVVSPEMPCAGKPDCPMTLDAGMAQLTVGLAWHYKKYAGEQAPQQRGQYEFAEEEARAKGVGLWRDAVGVAGLALPLSSYSASGVQTGRKANRAEFSQTRPCANRG